LTAEEDHQRMMRVLGIERLRTGATEFPPVETALTDGDVAYRQHAGGHFPGPNWPTFIDFASRYLKAPPTATSARRN